jgi:hypothetical protein
VASLFFQLAADKLSAYFGTKLNYGRYLEYGTTTMAARPWLRPTFSAQQDAIKKRVDDAVAEALKKAASRG